MYFKFYIKRIPNAHSGRERIRTLESRIALWPSVLAPLPPSNNNNNNNTPAEDEDNTKEMNSAENIEIRTFYSIEGEREARENFPT